MANFIKTITNSTNLFGGSPSSKWGEALSAYTMTWGTAKWGEGTFSMVIDLERVIQNTLSPATTISKEYRKILVSELALAGDISTEVLTNGNWRVVFVSDTTNVKDRDTTDWASVAGSSASYVCAPAASTIWS